MKNKLLGVWESDSNDPETLENYGMVMMEFKENGDLVYVSGSSGKINKILLSYEIDGEVLITDQKTHREKNLTKFLVSEDGTHLQLFFGGIRSSYVKVNL